MPDARATALANSRLFHAVTPSDAQAILAAGIGRGLRKGQVLIRQAEPAAAFFLIERGYLKLTQVTAEGSEVIVRFAGPWDPVAGVAALGETPSPSPRPPAMPWILSSGRVRFSPTCWDDIRS